MIVWSFVTGNGFARPNICEQVEGSSKSQVEGDMAFTNGCLCPTVSRSLPFISWSFYSYSEWALESDKIPPYTIYSLVGYHGFAVLEVWGDIDTFPFDGYLQQISKLLPPAVEVYITLAAAKMSFTDCEISGPMPSPSINVTI